MGGAKAAHRDHLYLPSKVAMELDPDMSVDEMTYVFSTETLLSTQEVLVGTVGHVKRFKRNLLSCEQFPLFLYTLT